MAAQVEVQSPPGLGNSSFRCPRSEAEVAAGSIEAEEALEKGTADVASTLEHLATATEQEFKDMLVQEVTRAVQQHVDEKTSAAVDRLWQKGERAIRHLQKEQATHTDRLQSQLAACAESYRNLEQENASLRQNLESLMKHLTMILGPPPTCMQSPGPSSPSVFPPSRATTSGSAAAFGGMPVSPGRLGTGAAKFSKTTKSHPMDPCIERVEEEQQPPPPTSPPSPAPPLSELDLPPGLPLATESPRPTFHKAQYEEVVEEPSCRDDAVITQAEAEAEREAETEAEAEAEVLASRTLSAAGLSGDTQQSGVALPTTPVGDHSGDRIRGEPPPIPPPAPPAPVLSPQLPTASDLEAELAKAPSFTLTLRRADNVPVGLDVRRGADSDRFLTVEAVRSGGAVEAWNRQCAGESREIRPGDRIIAVNAAEDVQKMMDECMTKHLLKMTVVRGLRQLSPEIGHTSGASAELGIVGAAGLDAAEALPGQPQGAERGTSSIPGAGAALRADAHEFIPTGTGSWS